jgi:hypothetical protein
MRTTKQWQDNVTSICIFRNEAGVSGEQDFVQLLGIIGNLDKGRSAQC